MIREMVFGLVGSLGLFLFGIKRMRGGYCSCEGGLIFIDLVDSIEKIGDHLTRIAQAVIGGLQWAGVEPKSAGSPQRDDRLTPIV